MAAVRRILRDESNRRHLPETDTEFRWLLQKQIDTLERNETAALADDVRGVLQTASQTGHGEVEAVAPMFSRHGRIVGRRWD